VSDLVNRAAESPMGWSAKQVGNVACMLCARLFVRLSTYRRHWAVAVRYAELSKLSDAQLERRGIARGDLHRLLSESMSAEEPGGREDPGVSPSLSEGLQSPVRADPARSTARHPPG
jgi:hypothetical protein